MFNSNSFVSKKRHVFFDEMQAESERRTWLVIYLCAASMFIEVICGIFFGSLALIADGLHMSTHVIAFLITALGYRYASKYANNPVFVFGTGKIGDLAGFTSAIIMTFISMFIFYEAVLRLLYPIEVNYRESIATGFIGLTVNILSAYVLGCKETESADGHSHGHGHGHTHGHQLHNYDYDPIIGNDIL